MKINRKGSYISVQFLPSQYLNFFSEENVNNMGANRGYRIDIGDMVINLYPKDWALVKGAAWDLNKTSVTKGKETDSFAETTTR